MTYVRRCDYCKTEVLPSRNVNFDWYCRKCDIQLLEAYTTESKEDERDDL